MILHHAATCWLLSFSMVANLQRHGAVVLFAHDFSDVTSYSAKLTVDGPSDELCAGFFLTTLAAWGYMRLYFFPMIIWAIIRDSLLFPGMSIFVGMLLVLLALHIFWYSIFIQLGLKYTKAGTAEDGQAKLDEVGAPSDEYLEGKKEQ